MYVRHRLEGQGLPVRLYGGASSFRLSTSASLLVGHALLGALAGSALFDWPVGLCLLAGYGRTGAIELVREEQISTASWYERTTPGLRSSQGRRLPGGGGGGVDAWRPVGRGQPDVI